MIFQVPGSITRVSTMANCIRIIVDTQENLNPDSMTKLMNLYNKLGWFTFNVHQIESEDIINLPELKQDDRKSPSQRLRAVLFRMWEQDPYGYEDFNLYYQFYMEKLIDRLKDKLV